MFFTIFFAVLLAMAFYTVGTMLIISYLAKTDDDVDEESIEKKPTPTIIINDVLDTISEEKNGSDTKEKP